MVAWVPAGVNPTPAASIRRHTKGVNPDGASRLIGALCACELALGLAQSPNISQKSVNWLLIWFGPGLLIGKAGETTGTSYIQTLQSPLPYRAIWAMTLKSTKFVP